MSEVDIFELFDQAWVELYCPPVRLTLEKEEEFTSPAPLPVINGTVYLKPEIVPRGCDPYKFLLWFFRHELAHAHHCPYDIRTAYSLERAAHRVVPDWSMAYLATILFSDLQVNLNYLPIRFDELPYFMRVTGTPHSSFVDGMLAEVYNQIEPISKRGKKAMMEAAREMLTIMRLNRPWHVKAQMLAIVLKKLRRRYPRLFSRRQMEKVIRQRPLIVREDFHPYTLKMFEGTFGTISDLSEAREFFKQWIEPRLSDQEMADIKEMLEDRLKTKRGGKGGEEGDRKTKGVKGPERSESRTEGKSYQISSGGEPILPTSLSNPYDKVSSVVLNEALWRRYWYRSRAENIVIRYLSESPQLRPFWAVMKYPDEWYIEDEIDALDIEMSLDEGPFIPEVTTLKWVEEPAFHGQSIISGFAPSAITVLDVSKSMSEIHDVAGIAAFIAYLSALKAGGQTSTLAFSTKYVAADWDTEREFKELTLSMAFGEFTVFPAFEVMRLASSKIGNCFIIIITDGGWQNISEALPLLERIADRGHKVYIFQLPGGEYPDRIEHMKRSPYLKIHKVVNPEADLQNIVLSETMKTYKRFLM